jgi:hypothetical protein
MDTDPVLRSRKSYSLAMSSRDYSVAMAAQPTIARVLRGSLRPGRRYWSGRTHFFSCPRTIRVFIRRKFYLYGMGSSCKSQIALKFAERQKPEVSAQAETYTV